MLVHEDMHLRRHAHIQKIKQVHVEAEYTMATVHYMSMKLEHFQQQKL
jgi:hypothetical protein